MMSSIFPRGRKLYAKVRDIAGKWCQLATGFSVGEEDAARRWAADRDRETERARDGKDADIGPLTVERYTQAWLARRKTASVKDDRTRLERHALPKIGAMLMIDVRPRHLRDLIMQLREANHLAPTTIRQVSGLLHTVFKSAVIEERIPTNPVLFERGVLPKKADKDPTWRHEAIYTRAELEMILSDSRVPQDRRVLYALKSLAALRHGEAARLTWANYDTVPRPLGAINLGRTKNGIPRAIPVHPTLAKMLAEWKLSGWSSIYDRNPKPDDLIVPTRNGLQRKASASQQSLLDDLGKLGLRTGAGAKRKRRGHDLRRTAITLARADGAIDGMLRWITHGPKSGEMLDVYSSPPWEVLCTELAKLKIALVEGRVLAMAANDTLGAVVVQSPRMGATGGLRAVKERPQRDSKALTGLSGATRRE